MTIMTLMTLVTLVASCRRRPLYYVDEPGIEVIVKVLWQVDVYPEGMKPTGVSLYFFRDEKFYMKYTTSEVDSCAVQLEPGHYKLYMISKSPNEYGKLEFSDMDFWDRAHVSILETKSNWYSKADDEALIGNPELMVAGVSEEFEVTEAMVEEYQHYNHTMMQRKAPETLVNYYTIRVPVYPKSIVSQYWVTIFSDNADVLRSVRASTSGMARSFMLTADKTGDDEGTQLISEWSLTMDDPLTRVGHIDGRITTFGFPKGEMPSPQRDSTLNVATLLIDNETVEYYVFNVGDKIILEEPPVGYRQLYRLVFGSVSAPAIHPPDVKPQPGSESGGFTAGVEDWGEQENVGVDI